MSEANPDHDRDMKRGITFIWSLMLIGMLVIVGVFAGSDAAGKLVASEVEALAAGAVNAIGLVAIGGINAIGVVSLGMVNSIGVVSVGGVNSVGVISIGGINSVGIIRIGGVNQVPLIYGLWGATIFAWEPRIQVWR